MASKLKMNLSGGAQLAYWRNFKPADFRRGLTQSMFKAVAVMHGDLATTAFSGKVKQSGMFISSAAGDRLAARTGQTRARLTMDVLMRGDQIIGVVGSPDKHVLANEVGATIKPKSAKMLAIPTKNILTPTGALKAEWASKLAGGGWRGIWKQEGLFVYRGKKGGTSGAWIARTLQHTSHAKGGKFKGGTGKGSRIQLLAYLTPSVTLIARHMMRNSARRVSPAVTAILGSGVSTAMRKPT